jgi:hypothetical protein
LLTFGALAATSCAKSATGVGQSDATAAASEQPILAWPRADGGASAAPARVDLARGEAKRTQLSSLDAPPATDAVRQHFGALRGAFVAQEMDLPASRRAVLVSRSPGDADPMLFVSDADGGMRFSFERPTGGMLPPTMHLALSAHELGGPMMFAYDAPTRMVVVRIWDDAGNPFADLELLDVDACAALSAAYWPKRGYLIVASRASSARAQLLREDGSLAFSREGVDVGAKWRAPAPISIAPDGEGGVMLVQHGTVGDKDHLLVSRYDAKLKPLWSAPVDVGEVPAIKDTSEHIPVATIPNGVRLQLAHGLSGSKARAVVVQPSGGVMRE